MYFDISIPLVSNITLIVAKTNSLYTALCYIDTSVLLENIPLVKFMKATSGTRAAYFP